LESLCALKFEEKRLFVPILNLQNPKWCFFAVFAILRALEKANEKPDQFVFPCLGLQEKKKKKKRGVHSFFYSPVLLPDKHVLGMAGRGTLTTSPSNGCTNRHTRPKFLSVVLAVYRPRNNVLSTGIMPYYRPRPMGPSVGVLVGCPVFFSNISDNKASLKYNI